jgi:hypothetical protein
MLNPMKNWTTLQARNGQPTVSGGQTNLSEQSGVDLLNKKDINPSVPLPGKSAN